MTHDDAHHAPSIGTPPTADAPDQPAPPPGPSKPGNDAHPDVPDFFTLAGNAYWVVFDATTGLRRLMTAPLDPQGTPDWQHAAEAESIRIERPHQVLQGPLLDIVEYLQAITGRLTQRAQRWRGRRDGGRNDA
jgi:hypothetical protein